ncbi:MAG: SpoIIE family protein phosphatase, partial [Oligoflexales bacterium]|nr:SpoIIE family protein phosphatase [Oligoflexales bacterium]
GALVRALGVAEQVEVDIYEIRVKVGEIFLTCSDGLTSMVSDRKITSIMKEYQERPDLIPAKMIDEANKNGGRDNITVIVSEVLKN